MTVFPFTDDYDAATDVPQSMSGLIDTGLIQVGGKISGTGNSSSTWARPGREAGDYSSLVGDGLASCIMGFDHNDKQRSRTILLIPTTRCTAPASDLSEAIEFAKSQGVTVTATCQSRISA